MRDTRRFLKLAEQGVILIAAVVAIVVALVFLEPMTPPDWRIAFDVIRFVVVLLLIGGLTSIAVTGLRELRAS